jgi:hypothetical protein
MGDPLISSSEGRLSTNKESSGLLTRLENLKRLTHPLAWTIEPFLHLP